MKKRAVGYIISFLLTSFITILVQYWSVGSDLAVSFTIELLSRTLFPLQTSFKLLFYVFHLISYLTEPTLPSVVQLISLYHMTTKYQAKLAKKVL